MKYIVCTQWIFNQMCLAAVQELLREINGFEMETFGVRCRFSSAYLSQNYTIHKSIRMDLLLHINDPQNTLCACLPLCV